MFTQNPNTLAVECRICKVVLNSQRTFDSHVKGKKHLNRSKKDGWLQYKENPVSFIRSSDAPLGVETNGTSTTTPSASVLDLALYSSPPQSIHTKVLPATTSLSSTLSFPMVKTIDFRPSLVSPQQQQQQEKEQKGKYQVNNEELRCDVCSIYCQSVKTKADHDQSGKHKRMVEQESVYQEQVAKGNVPPDKTRPYYCESCILWFRTAKELEGHLNGRRHTQKNGRDDVPDSKPGDVGLPKPNTLEITGHKVVTTTTNPFGSTARTK